MKIISIAVADVLLNEPRVFGLQTGFFSESSNSLQFAEFVASDIDCVQYKPCRSVKDALRGLHYQTRKPQEKLARVVEGSVFEVALDLPDSSPTPGQHVGLEHSAQQKRMLWTTEGYAPGVVVPPSAVEVLYKTTGYWASESEWGIAWSDPGLNIQWPNLEAPTLSAKDQKGDLFTQVEHFE